jgi:hypothetical protein
MSVWDILVNYYPAFIKGLAVTLQLCSVIWLSGIIFGAAIGLAGNKYPRSVGFPSRGF